MIPNLSAFLLFSSVYVAAIPCSGQTRDRVPAKFDLNHQIAMKPVQDAAAVPIQEEKHFAVSVLPSEHAVAADSVLGAFFTTIDGLGMRAWLAHETLLHWFENEVCLHLHRNIR